MFAIVLNPDAKESLDMGHVANHPELVAHLGDQGAAILAYVCRELLANAIEHAHLQRPGRLVIETPLVASILLAGAEFDSPASGATQGGLAFCRRLLARHGITWTHQRQAIQNCTTLTFTQQVYYQAIP